MRREGQTESHHSAFDKRVDTGDGSTYLELLDRHLVVLLDGGEHLVGVAHVLLLWEEERETVMVSLETGKNSAHGGFEPRRDDMMQQIIQQQR